jgi:hypothetical protein
VLVASWRIDRLENLGINPWSIPGLLPGIVGLLIMLLATVLAWQARSAVAPSEAAPPADGPARAAGSGPSPVPAGQAAPDGSPALWGRTLVATALCVLFAGVSLGRGLSFLAEAATFIFLFIVAFSWPQWRLQGRLLRGLATTLAIALIAAAFISWLFESVFLVRLP